MLTALARRCTAARRAAEGDEGVTLIEVVIALTVLAVLAIAVNITLLDGLAVSKAGRQRVAAANLASREIEIARNQFRSSDAGALALAASGTKTNPNPLSGSTVEVDGVPYTVQRSVQWLPTGNGQSPCDGGSLVNHPSLRVDVAISWPNMRTAKAVTSTTLLTPPKGLLGSTTLSYVAVKVLNAAGQPAQSVQVNATGPGGAFTQSTDSAGCAVFQVGTPGSYAIVTDMAGWVDQTSTQRGEKSVVALSGQLARIQTTYDRATSLDISLSTDAGYPLPAALPSVNHEKLNAALSRVRVTTPSAGLVTRVDGLWPSKDGYSTWSGACADSDPAGPPTSGSRAAPVVAPPGGVGAVTARLAPLDITVEQLDSSLVRIPAPGAVVTATSQNCSGNPERTVSLGSADGAGRLKASLPFGSWVLTATYSGDSGNSDPFAPSTSGPTAVTVTVVD